MKNDVNSLSSVCIKKETCQRGVCSILGRNSSNTGGETLEQIPKTVFLNTWVGGGEGRTLRSGHNSGKGRIKETWWTGNTGGLRTPVAYKHLLVFPVTLLTTAPLALAPEAGSPACVGTWGTARLRPALKKRGWLLGIAGISIVLIQKQIQLSSRMQHML